MNLIAAGEELYWAAKYLQKPLSTILQYFLRSFMVVLLKNGTRLTLQRGKRDLGLLVRILHKGWAVKELSNGDLLFSKDSMQLVQPHFGVIAEDLEQAYLVTKNLAGKNVLDIGGFLGETTVLFKKIAHCNHLYVCEPLKENRVYLNKNIRLNNLQKQCTVFPYGVAAHSGSMIVHSKDNPGNAGFGCEKGTFSVRIKTRSWNEVLSNAIHNHVYYAKVDCEGGEQYLTLCPAKLIAKIPHWVIEIHSNEIKEKLLKKFDESGFICSWMKGMIYRFDMKGVT